MFEAEAMIAEQQVKQAIDGALRAISGTQEFVVRQYYWAGRTEAEIAQELGISQPAVHLSRKAAEKKLRGMLII